MKERIKTIAMIIIVIISLGSTLWCCSSKYTIVFTERSISSIPVIEKEYNMFSEQFKIADSIFNVKYNFILTQYHDN